MRFDIVTIGSAVLDVLLKSDKFTVASVNEQLMVCEIYGGKMNVEEALLTSGGAATNTSVSFARQGFSVACLSEVGTDVAAQVVWDDLKREGVHTRLLVQEEDEKTGISTVLISKDGSRSAITFRGASHELSADDIDLAKLSGVKAIHLSSVGGTSVFVKLSEFCRRNNIFLSWNPSGSEAREFFLHYRRQGKLCDALFLNDQEWEGVKKAEGSIKASAKMLFVTRGSKGGELYLEEKVIPFSAKGGEKVVDSTGAGDAFAAGFVGAKLRGKTIDEAINFAVENAASVVGYMGAKKGLLKVVENF